MQEYTYVTLRQKPELKEEAATWFHDKWEVPQEAYLECMESYLNNETEYGWYLCLDSGRIVGGLGVIENDFHDRKDLTPNYTLLRKVVCQMGALPPLETPTRKGGTLPLHGAHTAFSCYPALRLYRLSKSQRGIDVVSLSK